MGRLMAANLVWASCLAAAAAMGDGAPHGFGEVAFQNSGAPSAQAAFLSGLALLHDFEYERAAAQFRTAETADPGFAMAYWGEAMTNNHPIWMQQDLAAGRGALDRLAPTADARLAKAPTEREKDYLRAVEILYGQGTKEERDLRYSDAMGELHRRFPDDPDAAALFALSILGTAHNGRDIPTYMKAAAILERLRCRYPDHPGVAHYLIHSVDDPVHAILGLDAARAYSRIAPEAAHAQHMCSHIFLALGLWDDVVAANETAVAVVNRQRREQGKAPRACGHYSFWLEYGYLQQGRLRKAGEVLEACRTEAEASPRPAGGAEAIDPDDSTLGSFAQMRTRYILDSGDWSGAEVRDEARHGRGPAATVRPSLRERLRGGRPRRSAGRSDPARGARGSLRPAAGALRRGRRHGPAVVPEGPPDRDRRAEGGAVRSRGKGRGGCRPRPEGGVRRGEAAHRFRSAGRRQAHIGAAGRDASPPESAGRRQEGLRGGPRAHARAGVGPPRPAPRRTGPRQRPGRGRRGGEAATDLADGGPASRRTVTRRIRLSFS